MTPLERYRAELKKGELSYDLVQEMAVEALQRLYADLLAQNELRQGWIMTLKHRLRAQPGAPITGLYLWGGVGRGKTHLVNGFHECLPLEKKLRVHFHRFMQQIHAELKTLRHTPDPLKVVAERLVRRARIICLDEFHVSDVADAMLLGRLLAALFERGVTLVATSNIAPDDLYRGGLQRERFLPAIDLLKTHTEVLHLDSPEDYRLRALEKAEIYHWPLDEASDKSLLESFNRLGPEGVLVGEVLEIEGRPIRTVRSADGIAWFDFKELCDGPRSVADYMEIGRDYHTVLIANIPLMGNTDNDKAARFIQLVDVFYDRNVNLIVSAASPPGDLYYPEGRLVFAFERTISRLEEMQSREYLARTHLP
ncbi:MAG: cell division protein ZapE [Gammaproteobacteria bacterium]|jgi:cell division protein ZapE